MDAKRPWTPSLDPPRLRLADLPEEVIGEIVPHMTYATLTCCSAVNKAFRSYGWSTWRKQVLLMKTSWGTAENYRRVFERHVLPKLERYFDESSPDLNSLGVNDCIEICTNLIHNFLLPRRVVAAANVDSPPSGTLAGSSSDSLPIGPPEEGQGRYEFDFALAHRERARVVLRNAVCAYKWLLLRKHYGAEYGWWKADGTFRNDRTRDEPVYEADGKEWDEFSRDAEHWRAEYMAVMSSCHVPVAVQYLHGRCGVNFKLTMARMIRGHCIQWSGTIAEMYPTSHFINGTYQRHDKRSGAAEGTDQPYMRLQWQLDKMYKQEPKKTANTH